MAASDFYGLIPLPRILQGAPAGLMDPRPPQIPNGGRITTPEQAPGALTGDVAGGGNSLMNFSAGPFGLQAQQLAANAPRTAPLGASAGNMGGAAIGITGDPSQGPSNGLMGQNGVLGGSDNQRFSSAAQGALAGMKFGGWPGAIIGGALGYGAAGGVKDANPIDASGFGGTTMDSAWQQQNLARLASNPAASIASKLGVSSNSVLGTVLDPASLFGGGKSHKRNWNAFNQAFPGTTVNDQGNYVLPEQFGGAVVNQKQLDDLAGTWYGATYAPDGDQSGWQDKYNGVLSSVLSQPMYNDFGDQP